MTIYWSWYSMTHGRQFCWWGHPVTITETQDGQPIGYEGRSFCLGPLVVVFKCKV